MTVSLSKGGKVNLGKESAASGGNPTIKVGKFGLKWDMVPGSDCDLDRFAIELDASGKPAFGESSLVYYNQPKNNSGSIEMSPDNRNGEGEGYDETGTITFEKVPDQVKEIIVCVSIFDYEVRRQNFGQVKSAAIDVINGDDGNILTHTDLEEDLSMETGAIIGRFRREDDGSWSFKALAETFRDGMPGILTKYGIAF